MEKYSAATGAENIGKLYGEILSQLKDGARHSSKIYNVDYKNDGLQALAVKLVDVEDQNPDFKLTNAVLQQIGSVYAETLNRIIEGANSTGGTYNEKGDHAGPEALAVKLVSKKYGLDQPLPHAARVRSAQSASGKGASVA